MPIRYRTVATPAAPAREGVADDVGELEGLVSLGSLSPKDLVALDGEKFVVAKDVKELAVAFKEKGAPLDGRGGGSGLNLLLWVGAGLVALVALGMLWRLAVGLVALAAIGAVGAGAVWLLLKLLRPKR